MVQQSPQISSRPVVRRSPRLKRKRSCDAEIFSRPQTKHKSNAKSCFKTLDKQTLQIRLFELLPGKKDEPLSGRLTTVSLEDDPEYDAISYVWGDPEARSPVAVDGKRLIVPDGLRKALTALRLEKQSRVLWADAICINQDDVQERGQQVGLMRDIYTTAKCVRVYLDVDVDLSAPAFRAVQRLKAASTAWLFSKDSDTDCSRELRPLKDLRDYDPEFWSPLAKIFSSAYWQRVWTQQELYLARDVRFHLPSGVLPPDSLVRFDHAVKISYYHPQLTRRGALLLQSSYITGTFGRSLFDCLYEGFLEQRGYTRSQQYLLSLYLRSRYLEASDPRDRVYGLLGLSTYSQWGDIQPDYTLTRFQTYSLVMKHHVNMHRSLAFLCSSAEYAEASCGEFPTWLPTPEKRSDSMFAELQTSRAAARISVDLNTVVFDDTIMSLRGIKCDTVIMCASGPNSFVPISLWREQLEHTCIALGLHNPSDRIFACETVLELLNFRLHPDNYFSQYGKPKPSSALLGRMISNLIRRLTSTGRMGLTFDDIACKAIPGLGAEDLRTTQSLRDLLRNSVFIGTGKNKLGLAYNSSFGCQVQRGDEVWVLFGCQMPMILRPNESGQYMVIGPAVIHGLMTGEACEGILSDGSPGPEYRGPEIQRISLV